LTDMRQTCPYCRTDIESGDDFLCPECNTPHHEDCWKENKGCSIYGCSYAPPDEPKVLLDAPLPTAASDAAWNSQRYTVSRNGTKYGPYTVPELQQYIQQGNISLADYAWTDGMVDWLPLSQILAQPAHQVVNITPLAVGNAAYNYNCPQCGSPYPPQIVKEMSTTGWVVFVIGLLFCLVGCLCCFFFFEEYKKCPSCGCRR